MNNNNDGLKLQIEKWYREIFVPPDCVFIDILEEGYIDDNDISAKKTDILIKTSSKSINTYTLLKPIPEICRDDIIYLKNSMENYVSINFPFRFKIYKFFGWWVIFAGSITLFSICPICGQTGCPVGLGTTGILAGIFSLIKTYGKNYLNSLKSILKKNKTV